MIVEGVGPPRLPTLQHSVRPSAGGQKAQQFLGQQGIFQFFQISRDQQHLQQQKNIDKNGGKSRRKRLAWLEDHDELNYEFVSFCQKKVFLESRACGMYREFS